MSKELIYLKGMANGLGNEQTLLAINAAGILHKDQKRKGGGPYVEHPLRVATELSALGIKDDEILATALLHDVIEDCMIDSQTLEKDYHISPTVIKNVKALTKTKNLSTEDYYNGIKKNPAAILVKISDRCHNVSTMGNAFSKEKIEEYIKETNDYVIPLCKYGRNYYPAYSDQIFVMKYHIQSINETLQKVLGLED